jgi:conjugal transfer mating pair stabilization protein TraG
MWEVVTYGGGEHYRDMFNAVALMAGGSGMSSLMRLFLVLGLAVGIMKAMADFNVGQILKWFIMSAVIYGVLWVPKVQVQVVDRYNPGLTGGAVANVPIGVGVVASMSSRVGARTIDLMETAFSTPDDVRYSKTGMIYGAKLFERMRAFRITDARFDANMQAFIRGCVYYDILTNRYSVGDLAGVSDIWAFVTTTHAPNPGRSIEYLPASGAPSIVTCQAAATALNAEWAAELPRAKRTQGRRLMPNVAESALETEISRQVETMHQMTFGASRTANSVFQQLLMANAMRRGLTSFAAEAGGSALDVVAETQADIQARNTQFLLGSVGEKAIVVLKIVTELLFIGLFPILMPAFLLPAVGLKLMQGYFAGFLYLQLWGPMYVILHKIMMGSVVTKTAAAAYLPGATPGLKIANLESIGSVNADIAATAGVMIMMIPVMAGLLTRGAMAVGSQIENLQPFRSGAEAAGSASATGNLSFGNTAFDNHSWNNLSGNRWQTSASVDMGNAAWTDRNLNTHQLGAGGAYAFTGARSTPAVEMRMTDGVSRAATEQASHYRDVGSAVDRTWSQAQSRVRSDIIDGSRTWSQGHDWRSSVSSERRDGVSSFMQELDSVSSSLQKRLGVTEREAKQLTARAATEIYADASVGMGVPGGTGAKAGVRSSAGVDASRSRGAESQVGLDAARQELSSRNWGEKVERYTADVAQENWSSNKAYQQAYREVQSDTFSSSQSVADTLRRFENEGRRWEERADYARTQSAAMERTYAQEFAAFAESRLLGARNAYGIEIDRVRLGEILNPTNAADRAMLDTTAGSFFAEKAAQIETPQMLAANRNRESHVTPLTPFTTDDLLAGRQGERQGSELADVPVAPTAREPLSVPQEGRSGVRNSTAAADRAIDAQGEVEGTVFREGRSLLRQADALQAAHAATGAERLKPR